MSSKQEDVGQLDPTGDNVGQIREILFGGQIRAIDDRFETVEKRWAKDSEKLRKALEARISKLEKLLIQYREEAGEQLNAEGDRTATAMAALNKAISDMRQDAENQMASMQDDFSAEMSRARDELAAESKALKAEINSLQKAQDKKSGQLADDKVSRGELAVFLSEIAKKLDPVKKPRK
jgi:hypothetical protein